MQVQSASEEVNTPVFPITAALQQKLGRVKVIRELSVRMGTNLETARLLLELPTDIVMDLSSALRGKHATVTDLCVILSMFYGIRINDTQFTAMLVQLDPGERLRRKREKRKRRKQALKIKKKGAAEVEAEIEMEGPSLN
jgi:hypothetical protein